MTIKGVLLDYGGTIDSNGIHWGEVLWDSYETNHVPVSKEAFREAYSFGERALGTQPLVQPGHNFRDVLLIKVAQQFSCLVAQNHLPDANYESKIIEVAETCFVRAQKSVTAAKPVLECLAARYPLVLVSNFYGNINTILTDFGISHFFKAVVESAVAGVRKPDPAIFSLGVQQLGMEASDTVVIGDSFSKDIAPGKAAGCQTIWINKAGWGDDPSDTSAADITIEDFAALTTIL